MKEVGTLEEIGAEVGDMVEWLYNGWVREVTEESKYSLNCDDYRIVRKAAAGPVRTVATKEIVPGVYGKVRVGRGMGESVSVFICDYFTKAELTAAIDTLTQIRDALK